MGLECDLAERDCDEFAIAAHGRCCLVGPAFDRVVHSSGERAQRGNRSGGEFCGEEVAVVSVAGVRLLVGDDDALFLVRRAGRPSRSRSRSVQRVRGASPHTACGCGRCGSGVIRRVGAHDAGAAAGWCAPPRRSIAARIGTPTEVGTESWSPIAWAHHRNPSPTTGAWARNATAITTAVGRAATTTRTSAIVTNLVARRGGSRRCAEVASAASANVTRSGNASEPTINACLCPWSRASP